jgi:hypothetical protein
MTPENKKFLSRRLRDAVSKQPELKQLKSLLLRLGGDFIVAPPRTPDRDVPSLLEWGFLTSGPITLKVMKSSSCHQNVAALWPKKRFGIVGIATGYALSRDGLWRQHSWGILREGVLETTEARLKYFGIVLQGEKADFFAFSNSG